MQYARMGEDWKIRAGVPEDENCIATMWHAQLCHGDDAPEGAAEKGSLAEQAYRQENEPVVTALIRTAEVRVACDPDRSTYEPGSPAVIWAWAVLGRDRVYQVGVKRTAVRAGISEPMVRDLLGDRLERSQATISQLVDLGKLRMIPKSWFIDHDWMRFMRQAMGEVQCRDRVFREVARHVLDPERVAWVPSSKRAA